MDRWTDTQTEGRMDGEQTDRWIVTSLRGGIVIVTVYNIYDVVVNMVYRVYCRSRTSTTAMS